MKLVTRCPQCMTAFRVHEHQLVARQGKVRCGACGHVFDAYSALVEVPEETRRELASAAAPALDLDLGGRGPATLDVPIDSADLPEAKPAVKPVPAAEPVPAKASAAAPPKAAATESAEPPTSLAEPPAEMDELDEAFDFGPSRASRRARIAWIAGSAVLGVLLVGQILFGARNYIAAWAPQTRAGLSAMCEALGCQVSLPRQAEHLLIEASDLQSDGGGVLTLVTTIRNRARYEQAYPSLLLTLTDGRDQPLVRRVLDPQQYLGQAGNLPRSLAAAGSFTARVHIDATNVGAASYEVLVFYP
jgi:predicted Zn finger-like uncharacterized protein